MERPSGKGSNICSFIQCSFLDICQYSTKKKQKNMLFPFISMSQYAISLIYTESFGRNITFSPTPSVMTFYFSSLKLQLLACPHKQKRKTYRTTITRHLLYIPQFKNQPHFTTLSPRIKFFAADGLHQMILKFFENILKMITPAARLLKN